MELAAKAASVDNAERDFKSEGFFEYHLLHPGRPHHGQGQPNQAARSHVGGGRAGGQALHLPRRRGLLPHAVRGAHVNQKVGVYLELKNSKGQPSRSAPHQGPRARLQGRYLGQPSAHRRGLGRPHAQGREDQDQDGRRLRRGRPAHPEGLEEDRPRISTKWSGRSRCAITRRRRSPSR